MRFLWWTFTDQWFDFFTTSIIRRSSSVDIWSKRTLFIHAFLRVNRSKWYSNGILSYGLRNFLLVTIIKSTHRIFILTAFYSLLTRVFVGDKNWRQRRWRHCFFCNFKYFWVFFSISKSSMKLFISWYFNSIQKFGFDSPPEGARKKLQPTHDRFYEALWLVIWAG